MFKKLWNCLFGEEPEIVKPVRKIPIRRVHVKKRKKGDFTVYTQQHFAYVNEMYAKRRVSQTRFVTQINNALGMHKSASSVLRLINGKTVITDYPVGKPLTVGDKTYA